MTMQPIGASTLVEWHDGNKENAYISFGTWNDDDEKDSHGVYDDKIFFYAHEGEPEIKAMATGYKEGFNVIDYDLIYDEIEV